MSIQTVEEGAAPSTDTNGTLYVPDGIYNANSTPSNNSTSNSPATISAQSAQHEPEPQPVPISTSIAPSNPTPNPKLCGVCQEKESKYKCSRCELPYCSIACSTLHKATHPLPAAPATKPLTLQPTNPAPTTARAGTLAASTARSPFSALDNNSELTALFTHYPKLSGQLSQVWAAMQPPSSQSPDLYSKLTGKHNNPKAWNQERGMEKGKQALDKAREAWGKDGEGVREFGRLVLRLVEGVDDEELVRRELERENRRIVEALMEGEI